MMAASVMMCRVRSVLKLEKAGQREVRNTATGEPVTFATDFSEA